MKIINIILCANSYTDGWSYQENLLPIYHKKLGHEVSIITVPHSFDPMNVKRSIIKPNFYIDENDIKIFRLSYKNIIFKNLSRKLRIYNGLLRILKDEMPDLLFIHGLQFLDILKIKEYVKINKNIKIFIDGHEDFNNSAKTFLSKYLLHGLIWKHCANVIQPYVSKFWGVTPARKDFLVKMYGINKNKTDLLVMGGEDNLIKENLLEENKIKTKNDLSLSYDDFIILTGGKLDFNKPEIINLMRAVNSLNNKHLKLIFMGSVAKEYKNEFNAELSENVINLGWVESKITYKYMAIADIIIFPGLHSVLWEQAVSMGIPCVFRDLEGFRHIDIGGNCILINEPTELNLRNIVLKVYEDSTLLKNMKKSALSIKREQFFYSNIAKKSISYID